MHRLGLKVLTSSDSDKEQSQVTSSRLLFPKISCTSSIAEILLFSFDSIAMRLRFPKFNKCQIQQKWPNFSPTFRFLKTESLLGDISIHNYIKYKHAWGTITKLICHNTHTFTNKIIYKCVSR